MTCAFCGLWHTKCAYYFDLSGSRPGFFDGRQAASRTYSKRAVRKTGPYEKLIGEVMRTEAQIRASKINGARSRGPVTEEGKGRSRFGGLKDGVRAQTLILPGENAQEFESELERLTHDLQPRDETEHKLVHEIASAEWFQRRARRAQFSRLKSDIDGAGDREDEDVALTLDRLFTDAGRPLALYCISSAACGGPLTSSPEKVDVSQKPPALVKRLEATAKGCQAMIDCWQEVSGRVADNLELQPHDRLRAIRMLGKQPVDLALDQRVWLIYSASFGLHPAGREHAFLDLKSEMGKIELDEFVDRVQSRWPLLLDASDTPKCKHSLLDLIARNIERLEAKREAHLEHADESKANTAAKLAYDESPQGERLARHELACQRRTHRCYAEFWKYRRETRDRTEDGGRRAVDRTEDGGRREGDAGDEGGVANVADFEAALGVGEEVSNGPEKNLTSEPKAGMTASESADLKEVAACDDALKRGLAELSGLRDMGIGTSGTPVANGGKGWATIAASVDAGGPLLRPIS
jgi:hypothetical protein